MMSTNALIDLRQGVRGQDGRGRRVTRREDQDCVGAWPGPSPLPAEQGACSRGRSQHVAHGLLSTVSFLRGILSGARLLLILSVLLTPWTLGLLRREPGDEPSLPVRGAGPEGGLSKAPQLRRPRPRQ